MPLTAWATIAAGEYDQDSPFTTTLATKIRDRLVHLRQVTWGDGEYTGEYPHRHAGGTAHSGNMLRDFAPHSSRNDAWTASGYTFQTSGIRTSTTANHYARQTIPDGSGIYRPFGATGADFCLSIWVKSVGALPTAGELHFGLSSDGASTFIASCKAVIAFGSVTSSWKRFHMMLSAKAGGLSSACSFVVKNHSTPFDQQVYVTACVASLGQVLTYPEPGILEITNDRGHRKWTTYGGLTDCPIWDRTTAITSSTAIVGA